MPASSSRACKQPAAPPPNKRKAEREAAADAVVREEDNAIAALAVTLYMPALLPNGSEMGLRQCCRAAVLAAWEQNGRGSAETEGPEGEKRTQRLADRVRKRVHSRPAAGAGAGAGLPEAGASADAAPAVPGASGPGGEQARKKRKKPVKKPGPVLGHWWPPAGGRVAGHQS